MRILLSCFLCLLLVVGCNNAPDSEGATYRTIQGQTMGTYYRVVYTDSRERNLQPAVDSLLESLNMEVSTYIDSSVISVFNLASVTDELPPTTAPEENSKEHFLNNYLVSKEVYEKSDGAFDPTVMPLVNYWGFGYTEKKKVTTVDSLAVDSLMQFVGFDKLALREKDGQRVLVKKKDEVQLDFSGCAKGYGVDLTGRFLERAGIKNYLVDIGGEARAMGSNPRGETWKIGVNTPLEDAALTDIKAAIPLRNQSIATSGNYRNFYEVDGVKYSHTINPWTGFPERNTLLSATVLTTDCVLADAYATAFMVLGTDRAYQLATALPEVEAYFIYSRENGTMDVKYTDGLKEIFEEQ